MNKFIALAMVMTGLVACTPSHQEIPPQPQAARELLPTAGKQISPESFLRKLSFHLRGQTPESREYQGLHLALTKGAQESFFKAKIAEYLASGQHIDKMASRLEELFFLKPSIVPYYSPLLEGLVPAAQKGQPDESPDYSVHNSLNQLFRDLASRNLSWDTLLLGSGYTAFPLREGSTTLLSDSMFFSLVSGTPANSNVTREVLIDGDDARVAGSLTTSRFFIRYGNTALNKNRRRAAAVFRIFMCDDMKAVVVDEKGNQNPILDRVFPAPIGGAGGGGERGTQAPMDRHGSDKACLKCHYKLDPMGTTFQDSGLVLSPLASPGALVFTALDGRRMNIPGHGIREVAQGITRQDEYTRCQVQHFWNWFIGEDVMLDESTLRQLTAEFNDRGRKTNDFISYLVMRPEFGYEAQSATQQLVGGVKHILQNCSGCHAVENKGIPSFTSWPIGGNEVTHREWLAKIRSDLSLDPGHPPLHVMPPLTSAWKMTNSDLASVQKWFDLGAPNDDGGGSLAVH